MPLLYGVTPKPTSWYYSAATRVGELQDKLCGDAGAGPLVIGVHGQRGVGKSAQCIAVAHSECVQKHFRDGGVTWVCAGEAPDEAAIDILRARLSGKRCLLIVDDVWPGASDAFAARLASMVDASAGSRVLVTTRTEDEQLCTLAARHGYEHVQIDPLGDAEVCRWLADYTCMDQPRDVQLRAQICRMCSGLPREVLRVSDTAATVCAEARKLGPEVSEYVWREVVLRPRMMDSPAAYSVGGH